MINILLKSDKYERPFQRQDGSILIITLGFVIVFTLLGFASLYLSMVQNEAAERARASTAAFWLADAAIEAFRSDPQIITAGSPLNTARMGDGEYQLTGSHTDPSTGQLYNYRWFVEAQGEVGGEIRNILAEVSRFKIPDDKPVTTNSPVNDPAGILDPGLIDDDPDLDIEETFNENEQAIKNIFNVYDDLDLIEFPDALTLISIVNITEVKAAIINVAGPAIVIIDVRAANNLATPVIPKVELVGTLRGILFVLGDAELVNPDIEGKVFAAGQLTLSGTGNIALDPVAIDKSLSILGATSGSGPAELLVWDEQ